MLRLHVAVRKLITSWSMGQKIQPAEAREAAACFESGHVCRNCESHIVKLPDASYHWCPTCGVETYGQVSDICACGAHVGKHDAQLRCAPAPEWSSEVIQPMRRKVNVDVRHDVAPPKPGAQRQPHAALFDEESDE